MAETGKVALLLPRPGLPGAGHGTGDGRGGAVGARAVRARPPRRLGFDLAEACFSGSIERLSETEVTQPAMVATSLACLRGAQERRDPAGLRGRPLGRRVRRAGRRRRGPAGHRGHVRARARPGHGRGRPDLAGRDGRDPGPRRPRRRAPVRRDRRRLAGELQLPGPARGERHRGGRRRPDGRRPGGRRPAHGTAQGVGRLPQPAHGDGRQAPAPGARRRPLRRARRPRSCRPSPAGSSRPSASRRSSSASSRRR